MKEGLLGWPWGKPCPHFSLLEERACLKDRRPRLAALRGQIAFALRLSAATQRGLIGTDFPPGARRAY